MKLIARRGITSKNVLSNTKDAVILALNNPNIAGITVDLRLTKDGEVVLLTEENINAATNGSGYVKNFTLDQLRRFNVGTRVHRQKIAELSEILKIFHTDHTNKILVLNLMNESLRNPEFVKKVSEIVNQYPNLNIWITSSSKEIVLLLKDFVLHNKIGRNFTVEEDYQSNIVTDFMALDNATLNCNYLEEQLEKEHPIFVFPINTMLEMKELQKQAKEFFSKLYVVTENVILFSNKKEEDY